MSHVFLAQITNTNLIPDIARVVHDVSPDLSVESIVAFLGALFIAARSLRKALPDNIQTGKIGQVLKHLSLEINPKIGASPDEPAKPVIPDAPATIVAPQPAVITAPKP